MGKHACGDREVKAWYLRSECTGGVRCNHAAGSSRSSGAQRKRGSTHKLEGTSLRAAAASVFDPVWRSWMCFVNSLHESFEPSTSPRKWAQEGDCGSCGTGS